MPRVVERCFPTLRLSSLATGRAQTRSLGKRSRCQGERTDRPEAVRQWTSHVCGALACAPGPDQQQDDGSRMGPGGGSMPGIATAPAPQHMQALAQANKVRLARAELKRQVADGELSVADVVLDCPWESESMTIADLLMSQHRWGRTRCRRFLQQLSMNETKTIGTMTDRQRRCLAGRLRGETSAEVDPFAVVDLAWAARS